jgi:hypothetical protein
MITSYRHEHQPSLAPDLLVSAEHRCVLLSSLLLKIYLVSVVVCIVCMRSRGRDFMEGS